MKFDLTPEIHSFTLTHNGSEELCLNVVAQAFVAFGPIRLKTFLYLGGNGYGIEFEGNSLVASFDLRNAAYRAFLAKYRAVEWEDQAGHERLNLLTYR